MSFFCALLTGEPEALKCGCGARLLAGQPAQPATKSSHHRLQVSPPPKKLPFCPPLGSTVAVLKHIFCALPEEV